MYLLTASLVLPISLCHSKLLMFCRVARLGQVEGRVLAIDMSKGAQLELLQMCIAGYAAG